MLAWAKFRLGRGLRVPRMKIVAALFALIFVQLRFDDGLHWREPSKET
jgi:hypothetical protein